MPLVTEINLKTYAPTLKNKKLGVGNIPILGCGVLAEQYS